MAVIAEGIETPDQLAQLLALGCDFGQGFYLAVPMDAADLEPLLERPAAAPLSGGGALLEPLGARG